MTEPDPALRSDAPQSRKFLPVLLLLFVGSGCAALIYEVVWLQLLQLVIGSTAVSLGVLLATFMGGMCAGSLILPRVVPRSWHPLRVFAALELGVGAIGLAVLFGMPHIERVYSEHAGHGLAGILLRGAVAAVCLLPPTLLMGATLPAIARRVESDPEGVSWLGFFYGGNIAGAVLGCLLAGFYLLRVYDASVATYFAVGLDAIVAVTALVLAALGGRYEPSPIPVEQDDAAQSPRTAGVYLAIGFSGMAAMGAEVVWTRVLSLMLGATVYTFSLVLAVFLVGLGIGSSVGALVARQTPSARPALGVCQWLLTAAVAWTAAMIALSLPYWPIVPSMAQSPWYTFQLDLVRCFWAVLPAACLWGSSFPLALAAVARPGHDPGRLVGGVYAANTIGAIAGALAFSLVLVPTIGSGGSERVLVGLSVAAAIAALPPLLRRSSGRTGRAGLAATALGIGLATWLAWSLPLTPWTVVAFGRQTAALNPGAYPEVVKDVPTEPGDPDAYCIYVGEGMNVSVAVTQTREGIRSFHGAGKVQASTQSDDMRMQRMLAHLPALLHKKPQKVLVVACGAGVAAGTFLTHPDVESILICDIEPMVPKFATPLFGEANYHVVDGIARENPHTVDGKRVGVAYDDGRHYLRTTREKFDIISSDPIDPWVKGCAAMNTVEYYRMCRDHLNPGGIVCLWIPLIENNEESTRSLISTFFQVFPNGIIWSNEREAVGRDAFGGQERMGYDAVLFGQVEPTVIDVDAIQQRIDRPDHQRVKESLREVGFGMFDTLTDGAIQREEGTDLLATYAGQAPLLAEWSRGAAINTDRNLRLQYLAGMWLNANMGQQILAGILRYYRFPDRTFVGTKERIDSLKQSLARAGRIDPTDRVFKKRTPDE